MSARPPRASGSPSRRDGRREPRPTARADRGRVQHPGRGPQGARRAGTPAAGPRWLAPLFATRARRIITYAVALACAAVAGILLITNHGSPAPSARQYLAFNACLLTGSQGLADPQAAQAWAGMQEASLATRAKVEYLPAMGPQTAAARLPLVASLVQRHCSLVIAVGPAPVSAVGLDAGRYPDVRFVVVGGGEQAGNVTAVSAASGQITPAIDHIVAATVHGSGPT